MINYTKLGDPILQKKALEEVLASMPRLTQAERNKRLHRAWLASERTKEREYHGVFNPNENWERGAW